MMTIALAVWAAIVLVCHLLWGWVPVLDSANLAFHEGGHPLFGMLSGRLMVYGGTMMQLLIPGLCAFEMRRQQSYGGYCFCLIWFAENLLNVARYMADARAQQLPLVGGLDPEEFHDWSRILGNWGLLSWDTTLANCLRFAALLMIAATLWRSWVRARED